jgi:hypothetical protein
MEVACDPYTADILAKDTLTGNYVVIENRIGKTDHDHLGKAITYASVLNASTIIWVATEFTQEHKKAIDWLNDHTQEDISVYGVQIELWQIDDSKPALRFNVISSPNGAVREAAKSKNIELSITRRFQLDFWTKFRNKLDATRKIPSLQTPRPQYWFSISLGKSHIQLSNTCNTDDNTVGIRIYIGNKIVNETLPYMESKKGEIEAAMGTSMNWNPNPWNFDKVITLIHPTDFSIPAQIEESLNWLVEYTIKARDVFGKIIRDMPLNVSK